MSKKQILAIGRNSETIQKVLQLINSNENWLGTGSISDDDAIALFNQSTFDLVILGGGLEVESGINLRKAFTEKDQDITIIQHFGGISSLSNDIEAALHKETLLPEA